MEKESSKRTPYGQTYYPPVPSKFTEWKRKNPVWQFFRFVVINVKMLIMARKH